ncbi:septum formation protein [Paenibacillus sp. 1_12]|uniref:Maf family protein n=1 Tax=Paenibacillus sp. 1_12 TaxID=1566278 RepID=UPI0008F18B56|nr:Maf family protein [Paenibacillus sp. 1_12]SFK69980.1 septum formation protein [Paenibacillus sp. 1_12]
MSICDVKKIILASSSPRRQELIQTLGLPYEIRVSDVQEDTEPGMSPSEIVEQLSGRKAAAVCEMLKAEQRAEGIVIGSDTIVVLGDQVLGKPRDRQDAARMLGSLQGKVHHVYSGIACMALNTEHERYAHRAAAVHMKPMSSSQIDKYIDTNGPMGKAGSYDTTMHLGGVGQYRVLSESSIGKPEVIVGHTVSKVTFRPMSDEEIWSYIETGDPLDKAGSYGVQGLGAVFIEKIEGDFYSVMGLPLNLLYQMLLKFDISPFKV